MTQCLPKPYGWPSGIGISLQCDGPVNGDAVAEAVMGFGCPAFIVPKVLACLEQSNRYDCRVTLSMHAVDHLKLFMQEVNVRMIITD